MSTTHDFVDNFVTIMVKVGCITNTTFRLANRSSEICGNHRGYCRCMWPAPIFRTVILQLSQSLIGPRFLLQVQKYNESRPHRSLGERTPHEFARQIAASRDLPSLA